MAEEMTAFVKALADPEFAAVTSARRASKLR
jgi:hypothetical protein